MKVLGRWTPTKQFLSRLTRGRIATRTLLRGNQSRRDPTTILKSPNSLSRRGATTSRVSLTTGSQSNRPKIRSTILWSMVSTKNLRSKRLTSQREQKRRDNLTRSKRLQWLIIYRIMMLRCLRMNPSMTWRSQSNMNLSQTIRNLKNLTNNHMKKNQKNSKLTPQVHRKQPKSHLLNQSNKYLWLLKKLQILLQSQLLPRQ